jgi:hypothetical protein
MNDLAAVLAGVSIFLPVATLAVTTCGETVPAGASDVLQNDLVCAGAAGVALDSHAALDLNGHTITVTDPGAAAVYCLRDACTVTSSAGTPGELTGGLAGIFGYPGESVAGAPPGRVRRIAVENVAIHDTGVGVYAEESRVFLTDVDASNCGTGVSAGGVVAESLTANGNGYGIELQRRLRGSNITLNNNALGISGIDGAAVRAIGLNATGNTEWGIAVFSSIRLEDSDVRGNGSFDLGATRRPRLVNSLCDRSLDLRGPSFGGNWGVCALD